MDGNYSGTAVLRQVLRSAKQLLEIGQRDNCGNQAAAILRQWAPFENQGLTKIQLESCGVIGWIGDVLGSNCAKVPDDR